MSNPTRIKKSFSNFTTIQLPRIGYQCFCFNDQYTILYLFDNNNYLVEIDLLGMGILK